MKRSHTGVLLVVLAGVLLVRVINSTRDPIAALEEFGAKNEKLHTVRPIERNGKGEVVAVNLGGAFIENTMIQSCWPDCSGADPAWE